MFTLRINQNSPWQSIGNSKVLTSRIIRNQLGIYLDVQAIYHELTRTYLRNSFKINFKNLLGIAFQLTSRNDQELTSRID